MKKVFDLSAYYKRIPRTAWKQPTPRPPDQPHPADGELGHFLEGYHGSDAEKAKLFDAVAPINRFKHDVRGAIARRLAQDIGVAPTQALVAQDLISTSAASGYIEPAVFQELLSLAFPGETWEHVIETVRAGQVLPKAAQYRLTHDQVHIGPNLEAPPTHTLGPADAADPTGTRELTFTAAVETRSSAQPAALPSTAVQVRSREVAMLRDQLGAALETRRDHDKAEPSLPEIAEDIGLGRKTLRYQLEHWQGAIDPDWHWRPADLILEKIAAGRIKPRRRSRRQVVPESEP
jgi:hypothetical protein